jgi:hypothetical protein
MVGRMPSEKHWYVIPLVFMAMGMFIFIRIDIESPHFMWRAFYCLALWYVALLMAVNARKYPPQVGSALLPNTCECPGCHARVNTAEALWLNRHGDPYFAPYSELDQQAMRCPACKVRFRQSPLEGGRTRGAVWVFVVSFLMMFIAFAVWNVWVAISLAAAAGSALYYLIRSVEYEIVGGGIAAEELLPLPDPSPAPATSRLERATYLLLLPLVAIAADALLRKSGYPALPWLAPTGLIAGLSGIAALSLVAATIGQRAVSRRVWPIVDAARYPLRPLASLEGAQAALAGWIYLLVGAGVAAASLCFAVFILLI